MTTTRDQMIRRAQQSGLSSDQALRMTSQELKRWLTKQSPISPPRFRREREPRCAPSNASPLPWRHVDPVPHAFLPHAYLGDRFYQQQHVPLDPIMIPPPLSDGMHVSEEKRVPPEDPQDGSACTSPEDPNKNRDDDDDNATLVDIGAPSDELTSRLRRFTFLCTVESEFVKAYTTNRKVLEQVRSNIDTDDIALLQGELNDIEQKLHDLRTEKSEIYQQLQVVHKDRETTYRNITEAWDDRTDGRIREKLAQKIKDCEIHLKRMAQHFTSS